MLSDTVGYDRPREDDNAPAIVKKAVLRGLQQDGCITPAIEAKVQRAVDLLRLERNSGEALRQVEAISCMLRRMHHFKLDGRVNAYASSMLRLRKSVEAL